MRVKDAIDLLQGHYIVSVSRDLIPTSQKGGLEALAVSTIRQPFVLFIKFQYLSLFYSLRPKVASSVHFSKI